MASKGSKRGAMPPAARTSVLTPAAASIIAFDGEPPVPVGLETSEPVPMVPFAQPEAVSPTVEALIEAAHATVIEAAPETAIEAPQEISAPQEIAVKAAPAAETIIETAEAVTTTAADTIADITQKEDTIMATNFDTTTSNVAPLFGDMNDRAKSAMEKTGKMAEEMTDFAKGNVEAIVEASRIAAKGFESMGQDAAEFGRKSFETVTANFKTLATVKSPTEFFKLQNDLMRQSFDSFVAEASKGTETMLKLAGEAAQPLSNRVAVAADKVKTAA